MKFDEGFTYDDVLLIPQRSFIDHRHEISLKTHLTRTIEMSLPFLSANMDTVTESAMAIALATEGGIGIIHRFMTIDEQVREVAKVKRNVGFVLSAPYTIRPDDTIEQILQQKTQTGIDCFVVTAKAGRVVGIISRRDYQFAPSPNTPVAKLMTPRKRLIVGNRKTTIQEAKKIFASQKIEKLPLVDRHGMLVGLITARSVKNFEKFPHSTKDAYGRYRVGAAVGVVDDYLDRTKALLTAGADVVMVDVAHGHNDVSLRAIKTIRKLYKDTEIIGGNVATPEGVADLIAAGVDAVKVGIGPGGLCTTRIVAGVGVPQLTAIMRASARAKKSGVPIIADGGTNYPGDITKALAGGASAIMLAGWFAGTDESPGGIILRKGMKYKIHRGSASFLATADRKLKFKQTTEDRLNSIVAEGIEALIPYKGKVADVIYQLSGALKSGMSYCNARTIKELWKNARFIRITDAGFRESKSHNVEEL
ncbi:MAG: IMP dehydrogenase [Candidatus Chisholmbacteria bacterium RIFCSPLOWO2_01_FULL_50_28]|uniref:IMP dehydrogenase n=1 Tax=Candidatus Chisholmbacteria bacterium RIFCSPHIGHO2_01_FULL_52_32 TaxID=1797591 RepID=A0A1G1VR26_9BACT|nr:MAG: IMP dehydrogenase [Candidatus Chisholmbacteria bacterium RIFCSPHIGHO2_01_FULL_52_32]OGY19579.1 MAG: IMP dehydrogenase [Candidatus Chisholmbacteria bacterium RIFCSPLOWO2_01_FULL_50_28]